MPRTVGVVLAHLGVGHLTEDLLTLHNLMGDAGIKMNKKRKEKKRVLYLDRRLAPDVAHAVLAEQVRLDLLRVHGVDHKPRRYVQQSLGMILREGWTGRNFRA